MKFNTFFRQFLGHFLCNNIMDFYIIVDYQSHICKTRDIKHGDEGGNWEATVHTEKNGLKQSRFVITACNGDTKNNTHTQTLCALFLVICKSIKWQFKINKSLQKFQLQTQAQQIGLMCCTECLISICDFPHVCGAAIKLFCTEKC